MTLWQPGMIVTAERLNDFTPVPLSITPTPGAGFDLSSFTARKTGGITEWTATLTRTGAAITGGAYNSATPGNITDTLCLTLPAECRPDAEYYTAFDAHGTVGGGLRVVPGGECYLTHVYPSTTIATGNIIRFSGAFATG